jgi:hypothetical protein
MRAGWQGSARGSSLFLLAKPRYSVASVFRPFTIVSVESGRAPCSGRSEAAGVSRRWTAPEVRADRRNAPWLVCRDLAGARAQARPHLQRPHRAASREDRLAALRLWLGRPHEPHVPEYSLRTLPSGNVSSMISRFEKA